MREVSNWLSGAEAKVRVGYGRWVERHSREKIERETQERLYWERRATEKAALREVVDPQRARVIDPKKELRGDHTNLAGHIIVAEKAAAKVLHKATGRPVAYPPRRSFDLEPVVKTLREKYPEAKIMVATAYDGWHDTMMPETRRKHEEMEKKFGCEVVSPRFTSEEACKGMKNFKDLARSRGKEVVCDALDPEVRRLEREHEERVQQERQAARDEEVRQKREKRLAYERWNEKWQQERKERERQEREARRDKARTRGFGRRR